MKKYLNEEGNSYVWLIIFIVIFIGISTLVIDYGNLYIKTKKVKYTINRAVKAASLQIKNDETLIDGINGKELANGIFLIDESKAEKAFKTILSDDLGLDKTTLEPTNNSILFKKPIIKEFEFPNNTDGTHNIKSTYTSSTLRKNYPVEKPSVIAVLEFEIRGLFLRTNIIIDKLSSSQLTSIYD